MWWFWNSFYFQESLCIFFFGKFDYNVSQLGFIELLGCLYSRLPSNLSFQSVYLQTSLCPFLSSSSGTCTMQMSTCCCPTWPLGSVRFSSVFFSFCSSYLIIPTVLSSSSLILMCASISLISHENCIFNFNYCTLKLIVLSSRFLLDLCFSFLSLYWCFHFVHTLFSRLSPQPTSVSIFITVVLKSLAYRSVIKSSDTISVYLLNFCPLIGLYFCLFCMLKVFFSKAGHWNFIMW